MNRSKSGLEAARALGLRGYRVLLAEAERYVGGRITREVTLPGLTEWVRVRDYRTQQIRSMANVEIYCDNRMGVEDVIALESDHIVVATGAFWRADGVGLSNEIPIVEFGPPHQIFTPDDAMAGHIPDGPTVVFDDDHYYMGSVIAERLRLDGVPVTLVTPEASVCWGERTAERVRTHERLLELGVRLIVAHDLSAYNGREATIRCIYSGHAQNIAADAVVTVTARRPNDALFRELERGIDLRTDDAAPSLARIGDCAAPAIIAGAVFSGHRYARELDAVVDPDNRIRYDRVFFEDG